MRNHQPTVARVALAATVCLALAGSGETLYHTVARYLDSPITASAAGAQRTGEQDERLRRLREHLPPRGVVGYSSDGWDGASFTTVEAMQDYFLTQYAVAPVIVLRGTAFPIVIGNYPADSTAGLTSARTYPAALIVRRDLGDGVVLLEAAER
jgi:hypothetical protein